MREHSNFASWNIYNRVMEFRRLSDDAMSTQLVALQRPQQTSGGGTRGTKTQ